jgi:hypothetical protein
MRNIMRTVPQIEQDLFNAQRELGPTKFKVLAREWANGVRNTVGVDQTYFEASADEGYLASLQPFINAISGHHLGRARTGIILNELCEAIEAQLSIATYLHTTANNGDATHTTSTDGHVIFDPSLIKSPLALLDYLKKPITPATVEAFAIIQKELSATQKAEGLYHNFWSATLAQRNQFIQSVLQSPQHGGYRTLLSAISKQPIISDFLPVDGGANSAFQIGRSIIAAFVMTAPTDLAAEAVTGLIGAVHEDLLDQLSAEPRAHSDDERFGYRLGSFMNHEGPGAELPSI